MIRWAFWGATLLVFVVVNGMIAQQEHILRTGRTVLLAMRPVDPRSLMQGDYMRLDYQLNDSLFNLAGALPGETGLIVVRLDERNVATFARLHTGGALAEDEVVLRFTVKGGRARVGVDSFFFQEGDARHFNAAGFAEYRVTSDGQMRLIGLRDRSLQPLEKHRPPSGG